MSTKQPCADDTYKLSRMQATPFPNRLLEAVVRLPETEARIVSLVVRSTLGWAAGPGERRASAPFTYGELRRAVGIASKVAIATAIDGLVGRGMLEVLGLSGSPLTTEERRRCHRALRYRIARAYVEG